MDTYDVDVQHSFALTRRNAIVWGGGVRVDRYKIVGTPTFFFAPASRTLVLANIFVQDSFSITAAAKLILGLKLENDPYSGLTPLPNARISWKLNDATLLWAAASRAIRSPTPFDRDVVEKSNGGVLLVGDHDFQPEDLVAYEVGVRVQPSATVSFSVSTYYNLYRNLHSFEINPVTLIPFSWGNKMQGEMSGLEAWADYRATPWWRLSASYDLLSEHLKFEPSASALIPILTPFLPGLEQAGDDPRQRASLGSSMNLGHHITLDADLRYVDALPKPHVPSYTELNGRIGWDVSQRIRLSLSGFNLLHDHHQEFPAGNPVQRSFYAGMQLRF